MFLFAIGFFVAACVYLWKTGLPPILIAFPAFFLFFTWIGISWYSRECGDTATALELIKNHQVVEMHRETYYVAFLATYADETVMGVKRAPTPPALAVQVPIRDVVFLEEYIAKHPDCKIGDNVKQQAPFHYDNYGFVNAFERMGL
jgi:hypothetical protein